MSTPSKAAAEAADGVAACIEKSGGQATPHEAIEPREGADALLDGKIEFEHLWASAGWVDGTLPNGAAFTVLLYRNGVERDQRYLSSHAALNSDPEFSDREALGRSSAFVVESTGDRDLIRSCAPDLDEALGDYPAADFSLEEVAACASEAGALDVAFGDDVSLNGVLEGHLTMGGLLASRDALVARYPTDGDPAEDAVYLLRFSNADEETLAGWTDVAANVAFGLSDSKTGFDAARKALGQELGDGTWLASSKPPASEAGRQRELAEVIKSCAQDGKSSTVLVAR